MFRSVRFNYMQNAGKVNSSIAQKSAADFMQINGMDIIYIIVYNKLDNDKNSKCCCEAVEAP